MHTNSSINYDKSYSTFATPKSLEINLFVTLVSFPKYINVSVINYDFRKEKYVKIYVFV
jgi:hypothetical protein